jgi:hypothetical protein
MKLQKFISALSVIALALIFALQLSVTIPARGQTANDFPTIEPATATATATTAAAEQTAENSIIRTEQSFTGDINQKPGGTISSKPSQTPGEAPAHKRQDLILRE